MVKVSHRSAFNAAKVKEQLGIATHKLAKYKEMAQFLGSKKYKAEKVKEYFMEVFPAMSSKEKEMSRNAFRALDVLNKQPGANFAEGTWWQPFNAVTYMTDHLVGRSADSRLSSAWYGPNKNLKVKALEKAIEYAEAA